MSFDKVGVVGGGTMGAGIAEVCARAGCDVVVLEVSDAAVEAARGRVETSLGRAVRSGRLDEEERETVLGRLHWVTAYGELHDRELVIEAAPEDEALKFEVFRTLDQTVQPGAILAS